MAEDVSVRLVATRWERTLPCFLLYENTYRVIRP